MAVPEWRSDVDFCEEVNKHCCFHKIPGLAELGKMDYVESSSSYLSSGSTALGESRPLPQSSFTLRVPATYISSTSFPVFYKSISTDSNHFSLGFPTRRVPSGLRAASFLQGSSYCILQSCPSHFYIHNFMTLTKFSSS